MYRIMCKRTYYYIYLPRVPKIFIYNKDYLITKSTLDYYGDIAKI